MSRGALLPDAELRRYRVENILHPDMAGNPAKLPHRQPQVLTAQLRELEKEGILCRRNSDEGEEHLRYALTPYGRTLVPILSLMADWGANHRKRHEG